MKRVTLLIASRRLHNRGINVALRSLAIARLTLSELHVVVLGDGPDHQRCQDICHKARATP